MTKNELKGRTKSFALRIIKLVEELPQTTAGWAIGKQLIRSGTSVAANYRAACRARSTRDFIAKIAIVEEEADESLFWLEIIAESTLIKRERLTELVKEADELTAIFTAVGRSTKQKTQNMSTAEKWSLPETASDQPNPKASSRSQIESPKSL